MKKSMILFIAAAAAVMALVSCTKETPDNNGTKEEQNTGLRTLTVSFAPSTRTTLNDLQPVWQGGESISLNGTENVTVPSSAAGKTSFTLETTIQGDILAVYPADAWTNSEPHFTLSKQDGTFAAANICTANAKAGDTELAFSNQTAVIELNVPDGTTSLTVTSLNPIGTSGQRASSGAVPIADVSTTTFTVNNNSLSSPWYVAVIPGALLRDLNFDVTYSEGKTAQGGFSPNYIKSQKLNPDELTVDLNYLYTLPANSLHEYVVLGGKKWATMNVGASSPTEYGEYFAWGEVIGHKAIGTGVGAFDTDFSSFVFSDPRYNQSTLDTSYGFDPYNTPYFDDDDFVSSKYSGDKATLELSDDAAYEQWGGSWRMPTNDEFVALKETATISFVWQNNYKETGVKGKLISDDKSSIFFPAAGEGDALDLTWSAQRGSYWSSSLSTKNGPASAYYLTFHEPNMKPYTGPQYRKCGQPVRPVSQ